MDQRIKKFYRAIFPIRLRHIIFNLRQISKHENLAQEVIDLQKDLLYLKILHHFERNGPEAFLDEIGYLKKFGALTPFPYDRTGKESEPIKSGFDKEKKMPFVIHKDKRVYFPKNYSIEQAKNDYLNYIVVENIFDGKFNEKNPHQYITGSFSVKEGDIVLDIGGSEGLFLLDSIDKIKKGYIFEPDKAWNEPLKATFEPYMEKVEIINKFASDKDSSDEITIDSCLKNESGNIFMKIDVEGYESPVLNGSLTVLKRKYDIRVACCTYHRQDDADQFDKLFKDLGYSTEFSEGYMLFYFDRQIKPPYFRKGLIRAKN
jgi:hypothetical protein